MNLQAMTLDINSLRAPQKLNNQQVSNKKEDSFSSVLERSRENQEASSKEKVSKEKVAQASKEKVSTEAPTESKPSIVKETSESKESTLANDMLGTEESEKVIQAIAELLGISAAELEQMLATLQIGISDLLKGDNMQKLIMQVHGVEEPMDLLLIPEVASEIKVISSMLEEEAANTVVSQPNGKLLEVTLEPAALDGQEVNVKPETQVVIGTDQKHTEQIPKTNVEEAVIEVDSDHGAKFNINAPNNEDFSQNEEQSTPNQNNSANQLLDNLSQSMGEVFQTQNNQVNGTFETIVTRDEILDPRMVLDQIVEKIKVSSLKDEAQMSIQLKPEHLGKLNMEVVSKQGVLTAHFTVENEKTKAMIEQNIQSLRESLEDKGLVIQELEVTVGQNQNEDRQTYERKKSSENISDMISRMMNEDLIEEEVKVDQLSKMDENEVDFIA